MIGLIPLPYRIAIGCAVGVSLAGCGFWYGYRAADRSHALANAEMVQKHLDEVLDEIERGNKVATEFAEWKRQAASKRGRYADVARSLHGCDTPPDQFNRLYNASTQGTDVPETPGLTPCQAGTATYDTVASIVAENNARCRETAAQLDALISFIENRP